MTRVTEVAPDVYQISTYVPQIHLQFNQFLIKDEQPLLFHTGFKAMFPLIQEAVATVIDPASIRWLGFSHFESDECGALNQWLEVAPEAQPVCSLVGAMVSVNDFALRPALGLKQDEVLETGKYRFQFQQTPHVPHCWEAGLLFELTQRTLLASDLFLQSNDLEPATESDIIERSRQSLIEYEASPFAHAVPYTPHTSAILQKLACLQPRTIAAMHGSTYIGDGQQALHDLDQVYREVLAEKVEVAQRV